MFFSQWDFSFTFTNSQKISVMTYGTEIKFSHKLSSYSLWKTFNRRNQISLFCSFQFFHSLKKKNHFIFNFYQFKRFFIYSSVLLVSIIITLQKKTKKNKTSIKINRIQAKSTFVGKSRSGLLSRFIVHATHSAKKSITSGNRKGMIFFLSLSLCVTSCRVRVDESTVCIYKRFSLFYIAICTALLCYIEPKKK